MPELSKLRDAALEIFRAALRSADAVAAVRRAVRLDGPLLKVCETNINLTTRPKAIYAIAIGKAAHAMAAALDDTLGETLTAGLVAGLSLEPSREETATAGATPSSSSLHNRWRVFAGGHPLPNEASLKAARAAFEVLSQADEQRALTFFLISGGGSALLEWPRDESVTLSELREANRALVQCGASIAEINAVRRAMSAVKGGGLAARAPRADQLSLIISDTNKGDEATVASGPTYAPPLDAPAALDVVARYQLSTRLPASILRTLNQTESSDAEPASALLRRHYVLLNNEDAIAAAADAARERGFIVEVAGDIVEQDIGDGCKQLLERLLAARARARREGRVICLLSGGEFACPVRGSGLGGRNSETALRVALEIGERAPGESEAGSASHIVALSAGTDGIDGNSPAAGAMCDETTLRRASLLSMDARRSLETSDAHSFFAALGDSLATGATGTNVRDVRVLLAS
ncbi:MAG: glycerate 2-kinase [Blastocatellia bacterium]|jgi:hydroxypyruvate reductase|nr:glycerate 2-kinase [Blastocatellia bacterium]